MLKTCGVLPFQHDLPRHVIDVEEDISEELVTRIEDQLVERVFKIVPMNGLRRIELTKVPRLMRLSSRDRYRIRSHPKPAVTAFRMFRRILRDTVIKPNLSRKRTGRDTIRIMIQRLTDQLFNRRSGDNFF